MRSTGKKISISKQSKHVSYNTPMQARLTAIYLACMLSVFLLFPGLSGYRAITEWKWLLFCLISGGYILVSVFLCAELAVVGGLQIPRPRELWRSISMVEKLLLGYWLASAVSTLLAVDRRIAFLGSGRREGFLTITMYCWSCILVSRSIRPRNWMLYLAGASICLNSALCALQLMGYNPLGLYPAGMNYYDANRLYAGEFLGTVGNVDILSAVLCLAIPAFVAAAIKLRGKAHWLSLLFAAAGLATLCGSRVAGGFVGLLGCALISVPVLVRSIPAKRTAVIIVVIVCLVGLALVYFVGGRFGGTIREFSELLHGRWDESFGSGRLYIWRKVLPLVPERLLFGGGPDTLALRLDAAFERWDDALGMLIHSDIDTAHNEYLGILVDQGLLALLFYFGMLGMLAVRWVRCAADDTVCAICGCAVLGYSIQAFFGIRSPISAPYFYLALAILMKREKKT
jgi:O-antigen ligase